MLTRLSADLLSLVLLDCDFDSLRALLATSSHISELAMAMMQSHAWRHRRAENDDALTLAAWTDGEVVEACMGAFDVDVQSIAIDGHRVVCSSRGQNRGAANGLPLNTWQFRCFDAVEARETHRFGTAGFPDGGGRPLDVCGSIVAAIVVPFREPSVRLFDVSSSVRQPAPGGRRLATDAGAHTHIPVHLEFVGGLLVVVLAQKDQMMHPSMVDHSFHHRGTIKLQTWDVRAAGDAELETVLKSSAETRIIDVAWTRQGRPNTYGIKHRFAVCGRSSLAVVLTDSPALCVFSFPDLAPLREIAFTFDAFLRPFRADRCWPGHSLALDGTRLALGGQHAVLLFELGGGAGEGDGPGDVQCAPAAIALPEDEDDDTTSATRSLPPATVVCVAMSRELLAACINLRGVYVWDASTRELLRKLLNCLTA